MLVSSIKYSRLSKPMALTSQMVQRKGAIGVFSSDLDSPLPGLIREHEFRAWGPILRKLIFISRHREGEYLFVL